MEPPLPAQGAHPDGHHGASADSPSQTQTAHKKNPSGGGLFSKFSFSRNPSDPQKQQQQQQHQQTTTSPRQAEGKENHTLTTTSPPPPTTTTTTTTTTPSTAAPTPRQPPSIASALQQQKTRRRRGSLRKVALLGRGAQRERREAGRASLSIDVKQAESWTSETMDNGKKKEEERAGLGLGISDVTPRPSMDGYARRAANTAPAVAAATLLAPPTTEGGGGAGAGAGAGPEAGGAKVRPKVEIDEPTPVSPTISYTTTDDEDAILMGRNPSGRGGPELASLSSGSDGFFGRVEAVPRRRTTISRARSPLIAATSLLTAEDDWDYSETEWWGWVILVVTWVVFVVGMGSVFGVWSWAWDVGTTPYAPPELEDDPTLPITGYYPCLLILTCVMAWVWVVSAWVGMKYFRHAKISGD